MGCCRESRLERMAAAVLCRIHLMALKGRLTVASAAPVIESPLTPSMNSMPRPNSRRGRVKALATGGAQQEPEPCEVPASGQGL